MSQDNLSALLRQKRLQKTGEHPAAKPSSATGVLSSQHSNIDTSVKLIDIALIDVEEQVRKNFSDEYIRDLAEDFSKSETYQPNKPITVWERGNGRYLLDDGENRFRAFKWAAENRDSFGIEDLTAFTAIRATVRGPEPDLLERRRSQAKANLLSDQLTDYEAAATAQLFLKENPEANHGDAAEWIGFKNRNSGRVKLSRALKVLETCDADLLEEFKANAIGARKALEIQDIRNKESSRQTDIEDKPQPENNGEPQNNKKSESEKALAKAKSGKKALTMPIDIEALKVIAELVLGEDAEKLSRKELKALFDKEKLQAALVGE